MFAQSEETAGATWAFCLSFALLRMTSGCTKPSLPERADEAAIRELDAWWSKAALMNDPETTVSNHTDDAQLLPPVEPMAIGKRAFLESWGRLLGPGVPACWTVAGAPAREEVTQLRPVAAVDVDVAVGKVAGPEAGRTAACSADYEPDEAVLLV